MDKKLRPRIVAVNRRAVLKSLVALPLSYAGRHWLPLAFAEVSEPIKFLPESPLVKTAADAINIYDLEAVARKNLPLSHLAYLSTGIEADATIRANRDGFAKFQLRPRRLVDTRKIDMQTKLFGITMPSPLIIAPVSSLRAFHPEGDIAVANAARTRDTLQIVSTLASNPIEKIISARGQPVWYQLYPTSDWNITQALLKRAEEAGCKVVVLTVDNVNTVGRETVLRGKRLDTRQCSSCHTTNDHFTNKPMFTGLNISNIKSSLWPGMTWEFVDKIRNATSMKLILKGIVTAEDAKLALKHDVDGIIVSNHGGRAEESLRSTIESLPEVIEAVAGKIPVLIDSGFRRGSDIFKALALGATAVCVGRPYVWGLAAFGQSGVERSIDILTKELEVTMLSMGTPNLSSINRNFIIRS
jgi:4-hydroxymandelate oxidase